MTARAVFKLQDEPVDAIRFVLTPTERSFAAWGSVHLEKVRRERNQKDAQADKEGSDGRIA